MQSKTLYRIAFTGIAAPALAFGAPAAAMADSAFDANANIAGPNGASSYNVSASAQDGDGVGDGNGGGGAQFSESYTQAGPYGAASWNVDSSAGDDLVDADADVDVNSGIE